MVRAEELDPIRSKLYVDEGVLVTTDGRIVCTGINTRVLEIKSIEKAVEVVEVAEEEFNRLKEFLLSAEIGEEEEGEAHEEIDDTEIYRLLVSIVSDAVKREVSDIHLSPKGRVYKVFYRVLGELEEARTLRRTVGEYLVNKVKSLGKMDITQKLVPQDGKMVIRAGGNSLEVRVSVLPTVEGERAVLRLQRTEGVLGKKLEDLGFEKEDLARYREQFYKPYGLILNVGATGQGKTTTFYVTLKELVDRFGGRRNVITVEDPVEIRFEAVEQVEVNEKAGRTFASVLRSALRQDPDVILVGEIRDEETASIAVRASLTGHLVLATLHATDSVNAISRLKDLGVSPVLIASTLNCILSQRLVRTLCECKGKRRVSEEEKEKYGLGVDEVFVPVGCEMCSGTGYSGRTAVIEVLVVDEGLKEKLTEEVSEIELRKFLAERGFKTLWQNALKKVERGETSLEEVLTVISPDTVGGDRGPSVDVREILYPEVLREVRYKNKKGFVFDISKRGMSILFEETVPFEFYKPVEIEVEGRKTTFVPTSYGSYQGKFLVGGKRLR